MNHTVRELMTANPRIVDVAEPFADFDPASVLSDITLAPADR